MLNHEVLLTKLERLGIRGIARNWFASYISGRSLVAKVTTGENTVYSESFPVTYGTAQGSCLGPLLFILFCNIYQLPLNSHLILFVNDTTMLNSHRNKTLLRIYANTRSHNTIGLVQSQPIVN